MVSGSSLVLFYFQFLGRIQVAKEGRGKSRSFQFFLLQHSSSNLIEQPIDSILFGAQRCLRYIGKLTAINSAQRLPSSTATWNNHGCRRRALCLTYQILQESRRNKRRIHCEHQIEFRRRSFQRGVNSAERSAFAKYI